LHELGFASEQAIASFLALDAQTPAVDLTAPFNVIAIDRLGTEISVFCGRSRNQVVTTLPSSSPGPFNRSPSEQCCP
jgi:hypothetical protein